MDVTLEAARVAGTIIRDRFNSEKEVHFKGRNDIVTDVDLAAEKAILDLLTGEFPEFSILAEESKPVAGDSPYKWVVDPLDGESTRRWGLVSPDPIGAFSAQLSAFFGENHSHRRRNHHGSPRQYGVGVADG